MGHHGVQVGPSRVGHGDHAELKVSCLVQRIQKQDVRPVQTSVRDGGQSTGEQVLLRLGQGQLLFCAAGLGNPCEQRIGRAVDQHPRGCAIWSRSTSPPGTSPTSHIDDAFNAARLASTAWPSIVARPQACLGAGCPRSAIGKLRSSQSFWSQPRPRIQPDAAGLALDTNATTSLYEVVPTTFNRPNPRAYPSRWLWASMSPG